MSEDAAPVALFSPFFLCDTPVDPQRARRTIMWTSVVEDRFDACVRPVADGRVLLDGAPPNCLALSPADLRLCIGMWLSLHELLHSSGPLPLLGPGSPKPGVTRYAPVEEARVDMSAFLVLDALATSDDTTSARDGLAALYADRLERRESVEPIFKLREVERDDSPVLIQCCIR